MILLFVSDTGLFIVDIHDSIVLYVSNIAHFL